MLAGSVASPFQGVSGLCALPPPPPPPPPPPLPHPHYVEHFFGIFQSDNNNNYYAVLALSNPGDTQFQVIIIV